jgi:hypothetical protein
MSEAQSRTGHLLHVELKIRNTSKKLLHGGGYAAISIESIDGDFHINSGGIEPTYYFTSTIIRQRHFYEAVFHILSDLLYYSQCQ